MLRHGMSNRRKDFDLRRRYGITLSMFEALCDAQEGRCAICGMVADLHVDHCHDTGVIRGLLCQSCNTGLGKLGDSKELLYKAIEYLSHPGLEGDAKYAEPMKRKKAKRGPEHGSFKLTEEQAKAIKSDHRSYATISNDYGVSKQCVHRIKSGLTWKCLP